MCGCAVLGVVASVDLSVCVGVLYWVYPHIQVETDATAHQDTKKSSNTTTVCVRC